MKASVQAAIERKNNETAAGRRKMFAKRSSDTQMLDHLTRQCRATLDNYHEAVKAGLNVGNSLRAAMRELESATILAERRKS